MTTGSTQYTERLTRDNAVLLLVDHQVGLYTGVRDIDILQLKHNIVALTRSLLALKVPVVVTTTREKMWGPLIPELADVLHGVPSIERTTVNAWDDKRIVDAVKATGRKKLIVTGISTDVCLAFPAIAALADGFQRAPYAVHGGIHHGPRQVVSANHLGWGTAPETRGRSRATGGSSNSAPSVAPRDRCTRSNESQTHDRVD